MRTRADAHHGTLLRSIALCPIRLTKLRVYGYGTIHNKNHDTQRADTGSMAEYAQPGWKLNGIEHACCRLFPGCYHASGPKSKPAQAPPSA